jgi:sortase A
MNAPGFYLASTRRLLTIAGLLCTLLALASCGPSLFADGTTNQATPSANISSQPIRLRIPDLGIDASIQPVGENRYGAMEVPGAGHPVNDPIWNTAFWWKPGTTPGQPGNAVLAGHVDRVDGSRGIFWNLSQLQPGSRISITDQLGRTFTFQVTSLESFANPDGGPNDPIIQRVFGPAPTANLNLITCYGSWIGTEFNKRLVVFSTLVTST